MVDSPIVYDTNAYEIKDQIIIDYVHHDNLRFATKAKPSSWPKSYQLSMCTSWLTWHHGCLKIDLQHLSHLLGVKHENYFETFTT